MKILKQGKSPEEEIFRGTCHSCDAEVEFTRKEGDYYAGDQRDGPYCRVKCPTSGCRSEIYGYPV